MEERVVNIRDMGTSGFYVSGFAPHKKYVQIIQSKLGNIWNLLEQAENIN